MSTAAPVVDNADGKDKLLEGVGVGIKRDYKSRLPFYWSDIGLNVRCLAATMFFSPV
jgi:hypothetical protein